MTEKCPCFGCELKAMIEARHPDGVSAEQQNDILMGVASIAASILADYDVHTLARFLQSVAAFRSASMVQGEQARASGGLH